MIKVDVILFRELEITKDKIRNLFYAVASRVTKHRFADRIYRLDFWVVDRWLSLWGISGEI